MAATKKIAKKVATKKVAKKVAKKAVRKTVARATGVAEILVGRFGSNPETFNVPANASLAAALSVAGIELSSSERVWLNGSEANLGDRISNGDYVSIVTPKAAGRN